MKLALRPVAVCVLALGLAAACDDGQAPNEPSLEADVSGGSSDADVSEDTQVSADTAVPDAAEPVADIPEAVPYPEGPYGTNYLDITKDLSFYDPWMGVEYSLSDYYLSPDVKALVISSAAGWCTACQYEAWDLVEVYGEYKQYGLEVLYTLYEDHKGKPLWQDGAPFEELDKDLTFLTLWKTNLGAGIDLPIREANYPVLVDRGFVMEPYYNQGATPLTLIVRTRDMRIIYRQIGYDPGSIETVVKGIIFQP
jgi:hypothetical protein